MQLTGNQTEAINHAKGNLQLIACAGSGKTEVVAQHITKLLTPASEGGMGLNPSNVVAFTFTEKAAAELKQRALDRCRERLPGLVGMKPEQLEIAELKREVLRLKAERAILKNCR